jgi:hypothetical protein
MAHHDKIMSEIQPWLGGTAQFTLYSSTHNQLYIMLTRVGIARQKYLVCRSCVHIAGPTWWSNSAIEIKEEQGSDYEYVVVDSRVGFRILCDDVIVRDDIDPMFGNFSVRRGDEGEGRLSNGG